MCPPTPQSECVGTLIAPHHTSCDSFLIQPISPVGPIPFSGASTCSTSNVIPAALKFDLSESSSPRHLVCRPRIRPISRRRAYGCADSGPADCVFPGRPKRGQFESFWGAGSRHGHHGWIIAGGSRRVEPHTGPYVRFVETVGMVAAESGQSRTFRLCGPTKRFRLVARRLHRFPLRSLTI